MIRMIKKVNCKNMIQLKICLAKGQYDEEKGGMLMEQEQIGEVIFDNVSLVQVNGGRIVVGGTKTTVDLKYEKKIQNGSKRNVRIGNCKDESGAAIFSMEEYFHTKKAFLFIRTGYPYFMLKDNSNNKTYRVDDITFGSDMHYYYIRNEQEKLIAAIYKPYKKIGEDEYHIYATEDELERMLYFLITYVDFFFYPYNSEHHYDIDEANDDAAYDISDEELLSIYDKDFIGRVILDEKNM